MLSGEVADSQVFGLIRWFMMPSANTDDINKEMPVTLISCFR